MFVLLVPVVMGAGAWQGWRWWSWASAPVNAIGDDSAQAAGAPDQASDAAVQIEIPQGTSAQQIGEDLAAAGLIRSTTAWELWTRWLSMQNTPGGYQAGTYEISPSDSLPEVAEKIWTGQVVQSTYTIPEGWSLKQIGEYLEEKGFFSAEAFSQAAMQIPRDRYPWLPENLPHLEGFLFPDTYVVAGEVTPTAVINQMLDRFQQVALPVYERGKGISPYSLLEWVTLASIVEKEAVVDTERPVIASVFAKRLDENIPLAADPTVEYALGIRQTVDKPLTYAQVGTPSPYNTYVNPGLPPTPIAAPGLSSLEVSIKPADTEYLYFMARYDGTHIFSRTLAEHEAAKTAVDEQLEAQSQGQSDATN